MSLAGAEHERLVVRIERRQEDFDALPLSLVNHDLAVEVGFLIKPTFLDFAFDNIVI